MQATTPRVSPRSSSSNSANTQDRIDCSSELPSLSKDYLSIIFESFLGQLFPYRGLLLLDETGQLLQSTLKARELCQSIEQATANLITQPNLSSEDSIVLPQPVMTLCEFLIDSQLEFPEQPFQLSDDLFFGNGLRIRLNAERVSIAGRPNPCILVRLEDSTQIAGQRALCDECRYGLTPRETEVWELYLQGLSYRQVGERLVIEISTVRKHMKSVYSKRRNEG
ncbi:MAG: LuxR C-terminal-related transcriptional regulator [Cyanobacteria bacterium P01_D01_bin.36]